MTVSEVEQLLKKLNPSAPLDEVSMYAAAYVDYVEADANIRKNGALTAHPRTGQPFENPYIKIRSQAMKDLRNFKRIKMATGLWPVQHGSNNGQ